jgi:hypothetical protein
MAFLFETALFTKGKPKFFCMLIYAVVRQKKSVLKVVADA